MSQIHAIVIDDNQQNIKVLSRLLAKQGVHCTEIADATKLSETLSTLSDLPPVNMVFVDLEMPGIDGFGVKDVLRSHFDNQVPIIAYTVHVSEMDVVRHSGFDGFLGKPIDFSRFPDQLARILRGEAVWDRA